jgi:SAM-dependent methyltransferase
MNRAFTAPKFTAWPDAPLPKPSSGAAEWDRYWGYLLREGRRGRGTLASLLMDIADHHYQETMATFRRRGLRSVLFVGNGISLLPRLFAHAGFHAVALDISAVASDFSRSHSLIDGALARFYATADASRRLSREATSQAIHQAHADGGSVEILTADVLRWNPGEAAFDAVIAQNVVEHIAPADRAALAERVAGWLVPGGMVVVESQFLRRPGDGDDDTPYGRAQGIVGSVEECFERAGFIYHLGAAFDWRRSAYNPPRWRVRAWWNVLWSAWPIPAIEAEFQARCTAEWETEERLLDAGGKLAIFRFSR